MKERFQETPMLTVLKDFKFKNKLREYAEAHIIISLHIYRYIYLFIM